MKHIRESVRLFLLLLTNFCRFHITMSNGGEENLQPFDIKIFTEMLEAKFTKMLDQALEPIHEELYKT